MINQGLVPPDKLLKLQGIALAKCKRYEKIYEQAVLEWEKCQCLGEVDTNLGHYECSAQRLTKELAEQVRLVEKLRHELGAVQDIVEILKNRPQEFLAIHEGEVLRARDDMETARQEMERAKQRHLALLRCGAGESF